jgi:hypothetical protein
VRGAPGLVHDSLKGGPQIVVAQVEALQACRVVLVPKQHVLTAQRGLCAALVQYGAVVYVRFEVKRNGKR